MSQSNAKTQDVKSPANLDPEDALISRIINDLTAIECDPSSRAKIEAIKSDLEKLKSRYNESDFQFKYLQSRERALQQFIDDFPSMLGYWNKDLINVHSNNVYAEYFGKKPEEIRGKHMKDLLGEKIFNLNLPYTLGVLEGIPQTFERSIPTPNGTVKHTLATYVPHNVDNNVVGFFVSVTDISDKKELEEKAQNMETALQEQFRLSSLGQMASGIAHEINNPITIIYSNAYLLLKEINKPDLKKEVFIERLTEIKRTALRVEQIVDGLRAIARGQVHEDLEENDIVEVIDQTLAICQGRFAKHDISIKWNPPKAAVQVLCRKVQVSEIILNILNNAFDVLKGKKGGFVSITVEEINSECHIHFINNGPPIQEEDRKKIFLPFFTTKGKHGTGLGLKISKDLATANQGNLFLSPNEMTEFVLTLKSRSSK